MKKLPIFSFICVIVFNQFAASFDLQCYQCERVTEECEDTKASIIKCGDSSMSKCSRQVKKDSTDKTKAVRKCVIPDGAGHVNCPVGYDCYNCNENLCNANPVITATTTSTPNSAPVAICAWSSLATAIFVKIYL